jgi:RNA polymerase sigma-70 factor (ECF subfamily)
MDTALIETAKRDPRAFGQLYETFYDALYRFVYLRVQEQSLTEELVGQLWEKILTHLPRLKSNVPEVFRAWAFTLARNVIHEHFRSSNKALEPLPEQWDAPGKDSPVQDYKDKEFSEAITLALQGLPALEQEIVGLKVFGEFKNKEIAELLGRPEKVIAAYLSRALKQLRSRLSAYQLQHD